MLILHTRSTAHSEWLSGDRNNVAGFAVTAVIYVGLTWQNHKMYHIIKSLSRRHIMSIRTNTPTACTQDVNHVRSEEGPAINHRTDSGDHKCFSCCVLAALSGRLRLNHPPDKVLLE